MSATTHNPYAPVRDYTYVQGDDGHTVAIRCLTCGWEHVYADHPLATFNQPTDPWTYHAMQQSDWERRGLEWNAETMRAEAIR